MQDGVGKRGNLINKCR